MTMTPIYEPSLDIRGWFGAVLTPAGWFDSADVTAGAPAVRNIDVAGSLTGTLAATATDGIADSEFASLSGTLSADATLAESIDAAGTLVGSLVATAVDGIDDSEFGSLSPTFGADSTVALEINVAGTLVASLVADASAAIAVDVAGVLTGSNGDAAPIAQAPQAVDSGGMGGSRSGGGRRRRMTKYPRVLPAPRTIDVAGELQPWCAAAAVETYSDDFLFALLEAAC
jgi:hypothetical protein